MHANMQNKIQKYACGPFSIVKLWHLSSKISLNAENDRSTSQDVTGQYLNLEAMLLVIVLGSTVLVPLM